MVLASGFSFLAAVLGGFRKLGVPLFWGPYNKDPTI